jgi:hypothetical protein
MRLAARSLMSAVLLTMAVGLLWYGMCKYMIAVKDLAFIDRHLSLDMFPESWLLRGDDQYYVTLDSDGAANSFKTAISIQPLMVDAWISLAYAELMAGRKSSVHNIMETLSPLISHVSTWKWQELHLANELQDENRFAECYNFILSRLPHHLQKANSLALNLWGGWPGILPHVAPENQVTFLAELMKAKETDVALDLWKAMEESRHPIDKNLRLRFCQFLITSGRMSPAKHVWREWREDASRGVFDGGFERPPLTTAFGWRFKPHPDVVIERVSESPNAGAYCLKLHFRGTGNISFNHVSQIVPVEPGRDYLLRFAQKSWNLTTDQGVYIEVNGYQCKGLNVRSEPLSGTTPWSVREIEYSAPADCEALTIMVRRKESLKFDSKIAGDYWLDAVEVIER